MKHNRCWGATYKLFVDLVENQPDIYFPGGHFAKALLRQKLARSLFPNKFVAWRQTKPEEELISSTDFNEICWVYQLSQADPTVGAWAEASLANSDLKGRSRKLQGQEIKDMYLALRDDGFAKGPQFAAAVERVEQRRK